MDKIILELRFFLRYSYLSLIGEFSNPSKSVHILNGHFIDSSLYPKKKKFDNFLKNLNKVYTFINFDEACRLIKENSIVDSPLLAFSFDDGFKECSDIIVDCLEEYNIKAAFFLNPYSIDASKQEKVNFIKSNLKVDFYKEFMNWNDIINLHKKGHIIGNHTYKHTALKNLTYEDSYNEILNGKKIIEDKLNSKCDYFAFPFGGADFFDKNGLDAALNLHNLVFTSGGYDSYFFNNNTNVLSRRHFEANWPVSHINYFLSKERKFNL